MQEDTFCKSSLLRRAIDLTQGAGWRSSARALAEAVSRAIALPLIWMLGAFIAFGLLGSAAVLLVGAVVRSKLHRHRVVDSSDDIIDMR